jgi:hypothetical protein
MKIIYIWEGLCVYYRHLCTLWLMMMKNKNTKLFHGNVRIGNILHVLIYITCTYLYYMYLFILHVLIYLCLINT